MFNPENFQSDRYVIGGGHLYDVIRDEVVPANEPVILLRASRLECVQVALAMAKHFDSQKPVPLGISFSGHILRIP